MNRSKLEGMQYVRLGPGAADAIAPYLDVPATEIRELVLDLAIWPEEIQPPSLRARDGRLIAGDPTLLGANESGLLFAGHSATRAVLVAWKEVRSIQRTKA